MLAIPRNATVGHMSDQPTANQPVKQKNGHKPGKLTRPVRTSAVITIEVARRIGARMGKGLTLDQACILEDPEVKPDSFTAKLRKVPELMREWKRQMAIFVDQTLDTLIAGDPAGIKRATALQFILERRLSEQFGKKPEVQVTTNNLTINGLPNDVHSQVMKRIGHLSSLPKLPVNDKEVDTTKDKA